MCTTPSEANLLSPNSAAKLSRRVTKTCSAPARISVGIDWRR
jgi:hypothetical protein